jgi:hypothetical protein
MSSDDGSEDDYFAVWEEVSRKDLLADLQVDDNDTGAGRVAI